MEYPYNVLIFSAAIIVLAAIAWFEMRYIKRRRGDPDEAVEQDHIYNSLATYRAVSSSLGAQGRDTTEADILLFQAEGAYKRGQFTDCKDLTDRAKIALRNAPQKEKLAPASPPKGPAEEIVPVEAPIDPTPVARETVKPAEVPSLKTRKMPCNYLESKFVIDSTKSMLDGAPEDQRETARCMLDDAQACFEEADYTDALRHAVKAKKLLEGCEDQAPAGPEREEPDAKDAIACAGCGAVMSPDDAFCFACGAPALRSCPNCSADLVRGDAFCRKCGTRL